MQTKVVQKVIILNDKGQILILRRSKTDVRRPLQWDFPGGLREEGEELIKSVKRETKEETGLSINNVRPVYAKTEIRNWRHESGERTDNVIFIFYLSEITQSVITISNEHDRYQWKLPQDAIKDFEYPLHIEALKYILDNQLS